MDVETTPTAVHGGSPLNEETKCKVTEVMKTAKDDFLANSTIHGLSYIHCSKSLIRRGLWSLLFLCSTILLLYTTYQNVTKLQDFKSTFSTAISDSTELEFPAVTFCNINFARKSQIVDGPVKNFLEYVDQGTHEANGSINTSQPLDIKKEFLRNGHDIRDMLHTCRWERDKHCNHENFTEIFDLDMGRCFTFNWKREGVMTTNGTGVGMGLTLTLDAQPDEYYGADWTNDRVGFRVQVHRAGEPAEPFNLGYDISPGFYHNLAIKRIKAAYERKPFKSNCTDIPNYSESQCRKDFVFDHMIKECNCSLTATKHTKLCTIGEYSCLLKKVYRPFPGLRVCPRPCEKIIYDVDLSSSYFPARTSWPGFIKSFNASADVNTFKKDFRERFAKISVYFRSMETTEMKEIPIYPVESFWGDLGGLMGLFLGCSLLSLCEVGDLLMSFFGSFFLHIFASRTSKVGTKLGNKGPTVVSTYHS